MSILFTFYFKLKYLCVDNLSVTMSRKIYENKHSSDLILQQTLHTVLLFYMVYLIYITSETELSLYSIHHTHQVFPINYRD